MSKSERDSPFSIRGSLLLWLLIPLISLCIICSLIAYRLAENFANDTYDKLLMRSAESIAARLSRNADGVVVADIPRAAQDILRYKESETAEDSFFYQIADNYGHRLTGDSMLPLPREVSDNFPKFRDATVNGVPVRMYRMAVQINPSPNAIWVQVAESVEGRKKFLKQIFLSIVLPQIMLVILASCLVWLGVSNGLRPLTTLGRILRSRKKLDLSPVDIGPTPSELAPVMCSLNELLSSASKAITVQKQFIANAAHQLRTPVTSLRTNIEYARRLESSDIATLKAVHDQIFEASDRVARMINQLLSLARTEEVSSRTPALIPIADVINEATQVVLHAALERSVCLDFSLPEEPVFVNADRGDLVEVIVNLLDNAIKYTDHGGNVWVRVEAEQSVNLSVEDDGPGVRDQDKDKVFDRFFRAEDAQSIGSGLGLAIVREIVKRNDASIQLRDRDGGGTAVEVRFARAHAMSK